MGLFIRRYNRYFKRNKLKHTDKGLVNFKNTHPSKKDHKKEYDETICYECGEFGQYMTTCPNLTKHNNNKTRLSTRRMENFPKVVESTSFGKKRLRAPPLIFLEFKL